MYLSSIEIEGFRLFKEKTNIHFNKGLNVLVGENGSGKSAVVDAIRILLNEDEYLRRGILLEDFHTIDKIKTADKINFKGIFDDLTDDKRSEYITWLNEDYRALLNMNILKQLDKRNRFKKEIWGGNSSAGIFEWEPLNDIQCVYLPPLRDAEKKLESTRGSRLARLLTNLSKKELEESRKKGELLDIEKSVNNFNENIANTEKISQATKLINENLKEALGNVYGQTTKIQFNNMSFERIVETLRLVFFPDVDISSKDTIYRNLFENSLGYNNLIYIAIILAEFEGLKEEYSSPRILLIEELEAHLHPQIQIKLIKYLEDQAKSNDIQIILTTHSPVIASSVSIDNHISFSICEDKMISITSLVDCQLDDKTKKFINRWLDATKSNLLFSKGNILVEGLAEAILLPKLASIYLNKKRENNTFIPWSLEEAGISVINMNGIFFNYFMKLFDGYKLIELEKEEIETKDKFKARKKAFLEKDTFTESEFLITSKIPMRCVALTDTDPDSSVTPTEADIELGNNSKLYLINQTKNMTDNCRVYGNIKTFEYDLALEKINAAVMIDIILENLPTYGSIREKLESYREIISEDGSIEMNIVANDILKQIDASYLGKGLFAQLLYDKIDKNFIIPQYIMDAIDFVLNIEEVK